jgi:hypothetical protein
VSDKGRGKREGGGHHQATADNIDSDPAAPLCQTAIHIKVTVLQLFL